MSSNNKINYQGSCLCGTIRYEFDTLPTGIANCHCSMCRKFHGAAFATFASVTQKGFEWTAGKGHLKSYCACNGTIRQFCDQCGSSLTFSSPNASGDTIEIAIATLDDDIDMKPDAHIFVAYKASWYDIDDALPLYNKGRDSRRIK